ncbi:MAG: GDSL-type esterase/lipase family protein [Butyrivibrio sp.]|nr:GDSL-type esterase/lipase family protein [Butyrivibrio sp.]
MKKLNIIPALILAVTVPALIIISFISLKADASNDVNTSEGESYLAALEKQDVKQVENGLRGQKETQNPTREPATGESTGEETTTAPDGEEFRLLEVDGFVGSNQKSYNPYGFDGDEAEKLAERIENGELSLKELFKNTLFVGDSIMVGFSDYKIANQGNVIAYVGAMMNPHLPNNIQTIADYNPEVLFLHYGLNEIGEAEYFLEKFIEDLENYLSELKAKLPYTKIVVVSLWPVKDAAVESQSRLARVPAYNEAIRKTCIKLGVAYNENSELFASNPDWYQKDGIHCIPTMYYAWINELIKEMGLY